MGRSAGLSPARREGPGAWAQPPWGLPAQPPWGLPACRQRRAGTDPRAGFPTRSFRDRFLPGFLAPEIYVRAPFSCEAGARNLGSFRPSALLPRPQVSAPLSGTVCPPLPRPAGCAAAVGPARGQRCPPPVNARLPSALQELLSGPLRGPPSAGADEGPRRPNWGAAQVGPGS